MLPSKISSPRARLLPKPPAEGPKSAPGQRINASPKLPAGTRTLVPSRSPVPGRLRTWIPPGAVHSFCAPEPASTNVSVASKISDAGAVDDPALIKEFEATIEDYDKKHGVDIISMITYPKSFWEKLLNKSVTKKMAFHSRIPVLAIPAG